MTEKLPEWDLTDLYPSPDSAEVKRDVLTVERRSKAFERKYKGKVGSLTPAAFGKAVVAYEALNEVLARLGTYAYLRHSTALDDEETTAFFQNIQERANAIESRLLFFDLEINLLSDERTETLKKDAVVARYAPWLDNVRWGREYRLNEDLERLLLEKSVSGATAWTRLYDETMANLRFSVAGKTLTEPEAVDLLFASDSATRHAAGAEIDRVFKNGAPVFSLITNTLAKDKQIEDKWRGFSRPVSARNIENQLEDEVVDALVDSVVAAYKNISHRYYALKARWLGVDKLEYWDRNAPIPGLPEAAYSWDEAKKIVFDAYDEFSPVMSGIVQKFFDGGWIDAPAKPGKEGGAYAHPAVPSVHPYILLNYMNKAEDVMTLAHELGHGIHQCLSYPQGLLLADTPLTLAETASVFGEMLTFKSMLRRESDPYARFAMIAEKTGSMINTSVRQIAFHRFEEFVHGTRCEKGELSVAELNAMWLQTQREALGDAVICDERSSSSWSGVPHFIHSPFYVYAYAFGDCLVNSLYAVYEEGTFSDFADRYVVMLSKGGSQRHKELLAPFGLDASKPDFWQKGLGVLSRFVDELEDLTATLKIGSHAS